MRYDIFILKSLNSISKGKDGIIAYNMYFLMVPISIKKTKQNQLFQVDSLELPGMWCFEI